MKLHEVRLEQLIKRLEAEPLMGGKVRVLSGSWPLLRELSPRQRKRVALAVGSRWGWRNLERLFGPPGKLSDNQSKVKSIFDRMRDADPEELRQLGKEIKKGGFAGAQNRLLGALEEVLEEKIAAEDGAKQRDPVPGVTVEPGDGPKQPGTVPPPPPAWLPPTMLDRLDESEEPAGQNQAAEQSEQAELAEVTEPGAADPEEPAETETEASRSGEPAADPKRHDVEVTEPIGAFRETSLQGPQLEEAAEPASAEAAVPAPSDTAAEVVEGSRSGIVPGPEAPALLEPRRRDATALSAVEALHALRRLATGDAPPTRADRAALVGSLGSGWAARRAVSSMIRSGTGIDLEEALALIQRLSAPSHRTWCLADLLEHEQLDEEERARVLALAPTEAAKRRLARRVARAG